jgi:hypothetical protein
LSKAFESHGICDPVFGVLLIKAHRALNRPVRNTELWMTLEPQHRFNQLSHRKSSDACYARAGGTENRIILATVLGSIPNRRAVARSLNPST